MKTVKDIVYKENPYGYIATIPAGTTVVRANNLPKDTHPRSYWCKGWRGMSQQARGWKNSYGFLLTYEEVKGLQP